VKTKKITYVCDSCEGENFKPCKLTMETCGAEPKGCPLYGKAGWKPLPRRKKARHEKV
jgi:hypothetical protein